MYANKAGFIYVTSPTLPSLLVSPMVCGGEMILSRFPIVRRAER